jgi:hypothetical protein
MPALVALDRRCPEPAVARPPWTAQLPLHWPGMVCHGSRPSLLRESQHIKEDQRHIPDDATALGEDGLNAFVTVASACLGIEYP